MNWLNCSLFRSYENFVCVSMAIESKRCPWKSSLFTQYRIRIANELRLAQREEHCNELRDQISLVANEVNQIFKQITPIDFTRIQQKLDSCISLCQRERKRTLKEYHRVKKQLIHLTPKLLIGNAYLRARYHENPLQIQPVNIKKRRKRLKLSLEQQWKQGIGDAYRKFQAQRDKENLPIEPLPVDNTCPPSPDEPPIIPDEHEFLAPLPPPPIEEVIIPFQTPPIACRSPPSDRLQLAVDDTIVKPHRLVNKTLGNTSHMSFHIDPDQCSSPKFDEKKKTKKKQLLPPPPLFSSTAIFDTHAFFTQSNHTKTKKQKKKIDISRQPAVMMNNDPPMKKKGRTKKFSPYDFQDADDDNNTNTSSRSKRLTDDIITARFAKNSHYQSHQTSMGSIKSTKDEHTKKKKKKNLLGIGSSSPLTKSVNLTLSPGRLSTDDDSLLSKGRHRRKKPQRRRGK